MSWESQLTLEQALVRIIPEYADQAAERRPGGGGSLSSRGMLCDFMDLDRSETASWNRGRQADLVIQALRRRHPTLLISSQRLMEDTDGANVLPEEESGNPREGNSIQNQLFNMDTNVFEQDHVNDHEDHINEDDDPDDHYENIEDECGGGCADDDDGEDEDDDDDEDEDEDPDEDNGDSEDNAILGDSTSFSNEMTALLAQLIADAEQHRNSDGSVFFSDLSWPVVCPADSSPQNEQHQSGVQSSRTLDVVVTSTEPTIESTAHQAPDSRADPGTSVPEESTTNHEVDLERREEEPVGTIWDSDEDAIDPEVFETVLHMMNSAESTTPAMYQDLLGQIDSEDVSAFYPESSKFVNLLSYCE